MQAQTPRPSLVVWPSGGNAASALQGAFVTTNTLADFGTGGVTLGADTTITTGAGAGNIAFGAGIAGAFDLGLTAGTGAVTVATTTNITDLTLTRATSNTFTGNVTVNDLITTANSGTITLNGAANTFVAAVDFLNTGLVTLGDAGTDSSTFAGGVAFGGNAASALQGAFVTTNTLADFGTGGVTLGADTTITTGAGAGNIAFGAGIADGAGLRPGPDCRYRRGHGCNDHQHHRPDAHAALLRIPSPAM